MVKVIECTKTIYALGEDDLTITIENNKDSIWIRDGVHFSLPIDRKDIKELYGALMEIDKLPYEMTE